MLVFANQYELPDNKIGIIGTYYSNHIVNLVMKLPATLKKVPDYSATEKKFYIEYLINKYFVCLELLHDSALSLTRNLGLRTDHPFEIMSNA